MLKDGRLDTQTRLQGKNKLRWALSHLRCKVAGAFLAFSEAKVVSVGKSLVIFVVVFSLA